METNRVVVKMTIELDDKWTSNLTRDEVIEYLKARFNSSLGFRGGIKRFRIVKQ